MLRNADRAIVAYYCAMP
jgi:hypothetical protein